MSDEPRTPKDAPKQPAPGRPKDAAPSAQAASAPPKAEATPAGTSEPSRAIPETGPRNGSRQATPPKASPPPSQPAPAAQPTQAPAPAAPARAQTGARTGLLWAAIVALFVAIGWLVIDRLSGPAVDPAVAALASRIAAIEGRPTQAGGPDLRPQLAELERRVAAVEQRADAAAALGERLAVLERRAAAAPGGPAADEEARAAVTALSHRVARLEARPAPEPPPPDPRIAELAQRVAALEARPGAAAQIAALQARLGAFMQTAVALEAGRPLGPALASLPSGVAAPAGLAAFADRPPPTLAGLRLRFATAAEAAREAREPGDGDMLERAGSRIAGLVTIRRGGTLVLGDTTAAVLADAERRLEAGDLAGTLAALEALSPRPAAAMAGWIAEARALLAAREGLATLAAGR
jgi:hypothetical protein